MTGGRDARLGELARVEAEVVQCRRCPRLVAWREQVARERRAAYADQEYWGRPLPGFGDPGARVVLIGLAPAAHGGNRTGRIFTGDRSGDWLFAALWRTGFANQPQSIARDDGLRLRDCRITAPVRCAPPANKPTPQERDTCLPWAARELALIGDLRVVVCLGSFAWDAALRLGLGGDPPPRPRPASAMAPWSGRLLGCFHPSQQNTFTGKLTVQMTDDVLLRARELAGLAPPAPPPIAWTVGASPQTVGSREARSALYVRYWMQSSAARWQKAVACGATRLIAPP